MVGFFSARPIYPILIVSGSAPARIAVRSKIIPPIMTDLIKAPLHVFAPAFPTILLEASPAVGEAKSGKGGNLHHDGPHLGAQCRLRLRTAYADSIGKSNLNHRLPAV